jgi:hypothetical protein
MHWNLMLTKGVYDDGQIMGTKSAVSEMSARHAMGESRLMLPDGGEVALDPTQTVLVLELLRQIKAINGKQVEMRPGDPDWRPPQPNQIEVPRTCKACGTEDYLICAYCTTEATP